MHKVAVIGRSKSVVGFRPLGFAVFELEDPNGVRDLWPTLAGGEYGVVLMTESVYAAALDLIAEVVDQPIPAVTVIPGAGRSTGVGEAKLSRAIERALGAAMPVREEEG
jgi:V/A-type H+-transporting ATPase subunit F